MGRIDLSKRISLIVAATVVAGNLAFADSAKNCITDLKLNNDGNSVRVNIYTNKPYTDSVVVSKKEGNKYVILVPETTSSVKTAPKVTGGGNVSVSMQTVSAGKGYTKIILTSDKAINVVPKTITYTPASKPAAQPQKPQAAQQPVKPVVQNTKTTPVSKAVKPAQKQTQTAKPVVKVVKETPKPVQKAPAKPAQNVVPQPVNKPQADVVSRNKPLEILEQEVKTDKVPDIKDSKPDALLEKTIKDNDAIIKQRKLKKRKNKRKYIPAVDINMSAKECIKLVLEEAKTLSLWKLLMLAGAITFPIIVIMIILGLDKRINKRINSMRKEDDVAAMERALKENVAAVRAQKAMQQASQPEQSFNSFDEMLDKVEDTPTMSEAYDEGIPSEPLQQEEVVDSDFELDETPVMPEMVEEIPSAIDSENVSPEEFDESVSLDEFVQSEMPQISDDVEEDYVQPNSEIVPFNPDGVLADFSGVNDKEFFDELVLQSFAEKDVNNLPENTPADEIFGVMTEDESGIMLSDFETSNSEPEDASSKSEDAESDDDVTMLNEAKINDKTGLYLVNYDNFSSLVGHIEDDYFVIKKFDSIVNGNIILKQAEKVENATRYLVRVGRNKMIVEVSDKSMSRLIDL